MKIVISMILSLTLAGIAMAQGSAQALVDTEHAFAQLSADTSTKDAFLTYLASDGVLFLPDKVNGLAYWNGRGPSNGLLSWAPNFADISANGIMGYTTGNWEFRPKGKDDTPAGFGEFVTVWLRQPNGKFKAVVDIGVGHEKPQQFSREWVPASNKAVDANERNSSAADSANGFYELLVNGGAERAYKAYAVDDIRAFREDKLPVTGKKALLGSLKQDKTSYLLAKRTVFFGAADLAYNINTYTRTLDGKAIEKGNTMQIWKLIDGKWRIVLDIYKPVP